MLLLEGVGETILEDAVEEGLVAVLGTVAEGGKVVGGVGHGLGAAGDDDGGGAEHDVLGAEDDGLERRSADLVHGGGNDGLGEASAEGGLASRALSEASRQGKSVSIKLFSIFEVRLGRGKYISYPAERTLPKKTSSTSSGLMPARSTAPDSRG